MEKSIFPLKDIKGISTIGFLNDTYFIPYMEGFVPKEIYKPDYS
jgi:hypothetical protein